MTQATFFDLSYDTPKLKLMPLRERPAYRVADNSDACNLAELLAVIIGGSEQIETADQLLAQFGSVQKIAQATSNELATVKGIGNQTALRLKASLALGRKLLQPENVRQAINNPSGAAVILQPLLAHREQEYLIVLPLNTRNHLLDVVEVYHGSLNATTVRACEVFKPAIQRNAAAIIVAHNHPSGDPEPSVEDASLNRSLVEAGKLLDIELLDHLVIGLDRWVSMKERALGFP